MASDFYRTVPKTLCENLEFRANLRTRAAKDAGFRRAMMTACRDDVLFFFGAWCWLHEPRKLDGPNGKALPHVIPFITWPHQEDAVLKIVERLGFGDIGINKSRGEGASWIGVLLALHNWLFLNDV